MVTSDDLQYQLGQNRWAGGPIVRGDLPQYPFVSVLPTASSSYAYATVALAGTPDHVYICLKDDGGTWRWVEMSNQSAKQSYQFTYSFAVNGGAQGTILLTQVDGPIPDDFVIQNAWIDVLTILGSAGAAEAALTSGQGAGDLVAATVIAGAPWSTTGAKVTIPLIGTINTWVRTTAVRSPAIVVTVADLNAGRFHLFVEGYVSV